MSDATKPHIITILAILAVIIGIYSGLRGALMIYNSIRQISAGFGGVIELIIGLLSAGVGGLALAAGVQTMRKKPGSIELMKKYAVGITFYQIIWIIFAVASGRIVGWGSVILDIVVGIGTFIFIITDLDRRSRTVSNETSSIS